MRPTRSCEAYIDGASHGNPGPAGVGVVVFDSGTHPVWQLAKPIGETTNNVAEYLALIYALQEALRSGWTDLTVKSDSELLVRQMNGQYKVRDARLRIFHDLARHLKEGFARCAIEHVPRAENAAADRLATQGARGEEQNLRSSERLKPRS